MIKKINRVAFIGAGNVASHMAMTFLTAGVEVELLINRHQERAQNLPEVLRGKLSQDIRRLFEVNVDLIIIAVGDGNIADVVQQLHSIDVDLVHTSGAISTQVFHNASSGYGSFYPLQTMTMNEEVDFTTIPICIHANNAELESKLDELAQRITTHVHRIDDESRAWLHLNAVMLNNNINHLLTRTKAIMDQKDLSMEILKPLLLETIKKAMEHDPASIQTGPARRNDTITYGIHMKLLESLDDQDAKALYDYFWRLIQNYYENDISGEGKEDQ